LDILEFLRSRRSVRRFDDRFISEDVVTALLEAGRLAPSRANSQPWQFIVVREQATKEALAVAYNQATVSEAPLLIVVLGVVDPRASVPDRTAELVEAGAFGDDVKEQADHVLDGWELTELTVDAALNSSIAATQIMLAAHRMGLGCCWVKLAEDGRVLETLGVPDGYYHTGILAIGYPAESPGRRPRLPLDALVHYEGFEARE
jgi:nitroreductase